MRGYDLVVKNPGGIGFTDLFLLLAAGYAIYAYAYKQQDPEQTKSDLLKGPEVVAEALAKAPQYWFETLQRVSPEYKEWSTEWITEKLDRNGNRPY